MAKQENVVLEEVAAEKLAILADGGMRDSLSMLEQAIAYTSGNITDDAIDEIYGLTSTTEKINFLNALHEKDIPFILEHIEMFEEKGIDFKRLTSELISIIKESVIYQKTNKESLLRILNADDAKKAIDVIEQPFEIIDLFMNALEMYRSAQSVTNVFEIACLKITCMNDIQKETNSIEKKAVVTKKKVTQEAPEIETEEIVQDEEPIVVQEIDEIKVTKDMLLGILVQCNKDAKVEDTNTINNLMNSVMMNKYIASLRQLKLAASGKDCILFSSTMQAVVNTLNERTMNKEFYFFLKEAGVDKVPYVVLEKDYMDAVNDFREKMKTNSLPTALKVERYILEEKKEEKGETPDTETKLRSLFGDDLQVYD